MLGFIFAHRRKIVTGAVIFMAITGGLVFTAVNIDNEKKELAAQPTEVPEVLMAQNGQVVAVKREDMPEKTQAPEKEKNVRLKESKVDVRATEVPVDVKTGKIKRPKSKSETCVMTVKCTDIFANADKFNPQKTSLVPSDGIIYSTEYAEFKEGETVFDVFKRELKKAKLHFDYEESPVNGAYVKGIGNIYGGDCGEMSGWIYYVNGESPQITCSEYTLQQGDIVEWVYICDMNSMF